MCPMSQPGSRSNIKIRIDYHAFFIYDAASLSKAADDVDVRAIGNAQNSGMQVGEADRIVVFSTPIQFNFDAPMQVETWPVEPPGDQSNWDHVVDIDLDLPSGKLMFRESGEPDDAVSYEAPPGRYRSRIAARGYDDSLPQGGGLDSYRLQLWPRDTDNPPELRKAWPGWAEMPGM